MKILSDKQYQNQLDCISMLQEKLNTEMERRTEKTVTTTVTKVRIEQAVFDALQNTLPVPCVPKSELEAGVLLGVQMVLEKIRKGWVV